MDTILLAGPGNNWLPLLLPLIVLGAAVIGINWLFLKFKSYRGRKKNAHL